jgi:hypothetical protein
MAVLGRLAGWVGGHLLEFTYIFAVAVLWAFLLTGCTQTRTVTVPAGESTINAEIPDTTEATLLPKEPPAPITRPENVVVFSDTPDYTVDLSLVEVDRTDPNEQTVTVRTQVGDETLQETLPLPVVGETLRGTADSTGLQWSVPGSPKEWRVKGYVYENPPWWERLWTRLRLIIAFIGGLFFGYVVTRLVPGI